MSLILSIIVILIIANLCQAAKIALLKSDLEQSNKMHYGTLEEKDRLREIIKNFKNSKIHQN